MSTVFYYSFTLAGGCAGRADSRIELKSHTPIRSVIILLFSVIMLDDMIGKEKTLVFSLVRNSDRTCFLRCLSNQARCEQRFYQESHEQLTRVVKSSQTKAFFIESNKTYPT